VTFAVLFNQKVGTGIIYNDTITEAGAASVSLTAVATFKNIVSEAAVAGDSYAATATLPNILSEAAAATDSVASTANPSVTGGLFVSVSTLSVGVKPDPFAGSVPIIIIPRQAVRQLIAALPFQAKSSFGGKARGLHNPTAEQIALALLLLGMDEGAYGPRLELLHD
jgi:hypothetical protein